MKMLTVKELKQNAIELRSVNRKLKQAINRISADKSKLAQFDISESQDIINGVIEWLEKSAA